MRSLEVRECRFDVEIKLILNLRYNGVVAKVELSSSFLHQQYLNHQSSFSIAAVNVKITAVHIESAEGIHEKQNKMKTHSMISTHKKMDYYTTLRRDATRLPTLCYYRQT